jgi:hypothetical protein
MILIYYNEIIQLARFEARYLLLRMQALIFQKNSKKDQKSYRYGPHEKTEAQLVLLLFTLLFDTFQIWLNPKH